MLFSDKREQLRNFYKQTWQKAQQGLPLDALEQQIAKVISEHPEYHAYLQHEESLAADFLPELGESNPFLHMGLHLAIREQVATDRPAGIQAIYQKLLLTKHDPLEVEHLMMEHLVEVIWQAQRSHAMPDEQAYLDHLKNLNKA
ncbi:MAG: hypothetical protein K0S29_925 [Gammaproteobacteria bacterium]|jgi:hypothetical protein|nr:hypothetical protein [Gammaproteobacteria bacterium]